MVAPEDLLYNLPTYQDDWVLIKGTQYVPDIIKEVCTAHRLFAGYYDCISHLFYTTDAEYLSEQLYRFCKKNLVYKAEPVSRQTSAIPTGIIYRGFKTGEGVDCKHYSLFCGGIIGSLNRLYGCCFDARFMFVGYGEAREPYHVFVSMYDRGQDENIWIDPTPGSGGMPSVLVEKKV